MIMHRLAIVMVLLLAAVAVGCHSYAADAPRTIQLCPPDTTGKVPLEQTLATRRSVRKYADAPISLPQLSQLLWAAQGITDVATGHRTAPSAMGTYPLHVYVFAGKVSDLAPGVYKYIPQGHKLELVVEGNQNADAGTQPQVRTAPVLFLITADTSATAARMGAAGARDWAMLEAGAVTQNILLEEVALGLIGVPMAGYDAAKIKPMLKLPDTEAPIFIVSAAKRG
jgi:SagB-type dehydrogenase family enzyme